MSKGQQWSTSRRPGTLKEFFGQPAAVAYIRGMRKREVAPNCILITGQSGLGKTTLARIIGSILSGWDGDPDKNPDAMEMAANVERSIDDVRSFIRMSQYSPKKGKRRIMIVDEVQGLVGPAGSAMLKATEDVAPKTTWILCTDQPWKLNRAMLRRCVSIALVPVSEDDLVQSLEYICDKEKVKFGDKREAVLRKIAKASNGTPGIAVQLLEHVWTSVLGGGKVGEAIAQAVAASPGAEAFDAAREYLKALIAGDSEAAAAAVASTSTPDGILEMINGMLVGVIRKAAGGQPRDGIGWAGAKSIRVDKKDLKELMALQSKIVAALTVKGQYQASPESILYGLAR